MFIRVIDFETTGIPTHDERHAICEAGWCDIRDGVVNEPHSMLTNPGRPIPPVAMAVHHITDVMVADAPPPDVACRTLGEGNPHLYAAHNADFDRQFFGGGPFICSYKIALRFWPEAEKHSNQFLRYFLGLELDPAKAEPPHRAGADAYVTTHIVVQIMEMAGLRGVTTDTLVKWSTGPALLPRCPIGQHRGKPWDEVPTSFLQWMVGKEGMERDLKANARHQLKLRAGA